MTDNRHKEAADPVHVTGLCTGVVDLIDRLDREISLTEMLNEEASSGLLRDARACIADYAEANEPHEVFYIQFADDGEAIRKWRRTPFEDARMCRMAMSTPSQHEED